MKLNIDGDILVYRAGFAADVTHYEVYVQDPAQGGQPVFSSNSSKEVKAHVEKSGYDTYFISRRPLQGGIESALGNCKDLIIKSIINRLGYDDIQIYLTGDGNFRETLATYKKYKGNRDGQRRPLHYDAIKKYLVDQWGAIYTQGEEADDSLGQSQTSETILCSIDKDLRQIQGLHYDFVKDVRFEVDHASANFLFFKQCLMGDSTDNIIGLPNVGDKTAEKILRASSPDRWWDVVVNEYQTRLAKKPLEGMELVGNGMIEYHHWNTGMPVRKTFGEYAEEVAHLVWIRKRGQKEHGYTS